MTTMKERLARALCRLDGYDPDGGPKIGFGWINYTNRAEEVLREMREPTISMCEAAKRYVNAETDAIGWAMQAAIQAAIDE